MSSTRASTVNASSDTDTIQGLISNPESQFTIPPLYTINQIEKMQNESVQTDFFFFFLCLPPPDYSTFSSTPIRRL